MSGTPTALSPRLQSLALKPGELNRALSRTPAAAPRASTEFSAVAPVGITPPIVLSHQNADLARFLQKSGAEALGAVVNALVRVTPELATRWLLGNERNRCPSETKIQRFAAIMLAGKWTITGEPIKFDDCGRLLDGQSRLKAIIRAGVAVVLEIRWGLPKIAQESMDTGEARSHVHQLQMLGVQTKYPNEVAAALRIVWAWEKGNLGAARSLGARLRREVTNTTIRETLARHPGIIDSVARFGGSVRMREILQLSRVGALHYLFSRVSPAAADYFWTTLAADPAAGHPPALTVLRTHLRLARGPRAVRLAPRELFAIIVLAWNAYRAGERVDELMCAASESFPEIAGLERSAAA